MKSFFRFFAERHILANLVTLMTILLGVSTFTHIKRDIWPQVDFGIMIITTRYPGASPEDVELNVTNKIEEELSGDRYRTDDLCFHGEYLSHHRGHRPRRERSG